MKKITILVIACLTFVIAISLMAFKSTTAGKSGNEPYILIEIYEVPSYPDRGIHIHYGNNKREIVPFKGMTVEDHDDAGDLILTTLNKFVADGYYIESTSAGLAQSGMITKIFMRKN